jgi:predicted Zn-dependent protease
MVKSKISILLLHLILFSLTSCSALLQSNTSVDMNVLNMSLGEVNKLKSQYGTLDPYDPKSILVSKVSQRIYPILMNFLREKNRENLLPKYEISIIQNPSADCYGLGGGIVVMHSGLLNYLQSEDEIAIMITHELAHEIQQHSYKKLNSSFLTQIGASLISGTVSNEDKYKELYLSAFGVTSSAFGGMKFDKKDDLEADKLTMMIISKAGYNPMAVMSIVNKLEQVQSTGQKITFLEVHPYTRQKHEEIQKSLEKYYSKYYLPAIGGQPGLIASP